MRKALSRKNLWEAVPAPLKRLARYPLAAIPRQFLLGSRYRSTLASVLDSQWWDAERIEQDRLARLRQVLRLAASRSDFYGDRFRAHGLDPDAADWYRAFKAMPLIDKSDVESHLEQMLTVDTRARNIDYVTTGGTSGTPLRFYAGSDRSAIEFAYIVAGWQRAGYRLADPLAILRGKTVAEHEPGFHYEFDPMLNHHYFSTFHMDDASIGRYLERIGQIGRCFLHVYPSSAAALARYIKRTNEPVPPNIEGILAESEILYDEQRSLIENTFNCRVFSSYGHTEKLVAAAACEESNDYHVWPTYGFFELLDEHGRDVREAGGIGEIVGTSFMNTATPFIRYRTGDMAEFVADSCPHCGRHHTTIRNIRGHRVQEHLVSRDGSLIPWAAMNMHDDTFDNVIQFQFMQQQPGIAVIKLRPAASFVDSDLERIRKNLDTKLRDRVEFEFSIVDEIALSPSGKSIFVDQHIKDQ